jgi:glycosyltransferase involved in cell wall biosynthesis
MAGLFRLNGFPAAHTFALPYFVEAVADVEAVGHDRRIAFVGRVVRNKGLDLLLRALACIPADWEVLVVCGDGWDVAACRKLARSLGIEGKVEFHGWTSRDDALAVIRSSRVLTLPSRWPEPFGIAGLEAMALRRPVVATNGGGVSEWLDDGETGFAVPPGDVAALAGALARVLNDDTLARRLGDEAYRRSKRFAPESHLDRLERIYAATRSAKTASLEAAG